MPSSGYTPLSSPSSPSSSHPDLFNSSSRATTPSYSPTKAMMDPSQRQRRAQELELDLDFNDMVLVPYISLEGDYKVWDRNDPDDYEAAEEIKLCGTDKEREDALEAWKAVRMREAIQEEAEAKAAAEKEENDWYLEVTGMSAAEWKAKAAEEKAAKEADAKEAEATSPAPVDNTAAPSTETPSPSTELAAPDKEVCGHVNVNGFDDDDDEDGGAPLVDASSKAPADTSSLNSAPTEAPSSRPAAGNGLSAKERTKEKRTAKKTAQYPVPATSSSAAAAAKIVKPRTKAPAKKKASQTPSSATDTPAQTTKAKRTYTRKAKKTAETATLVPETPAPDTHVETSALEDKEYDNAGLEAEMWAQFAAEDEANGGAPLNDQATSKSTDKPSAEETAQTPSPDKGNATSAPGNSEEDDGGSEAELWSLFGEEDEVDGGAPLSDEACPERTDKPSAKKTAQPPSPEKDNAASTIENSKEDDGGSEAELWSLFGEEDEADGGAPLSEEASTERTDKPSAESTAQTPSPDTQNASSALENGEEYDNSGLGAELWAAFEAEDREASTLNPETPALNTDNATSAIENGEQEENSSLAAELWAAFEAEDREASTLNPETPALNTDNATCAIENGEQEENGSLAAELWAAFEAEDEANGVAPLSDEANMSLASAPASQVLESPPVPDGGSADLEDDPLSGSEADTDGDSDLGSEMSPEEWAALNGESATSPSEADGQRASAPLTTIGKQRKEKAQKKSAKAQVRAINWAAHNLHSTSSLEQAVVHIQSRPADKAREIFINDRLADVVIHGNTDAEDVTMKDDDSVLPKLYHQYWKGNPNYRLLAKHMDLRTDVKLSEVCSSLGLDLFRGKDIFTKIQELLKNPGCSLRIDGDLTEEHKIIVGERAHQLLATVGWGEEHFQRPTLSGRDSKAKFLEKVSWGSASTDIFLGFSKLLYKAAKMEEARRKGLNRRFHQEQPAAPETVESQPSLPAPAVPAPAAPMPPATSPAAHSVPGPASSSPASSSPAKRAYDVVDLTSDVEEEVGPSPGKRARLPARTACPQRARARVQQNQRPQPQTMPVQQNQGQQCRQALPRQNQTRQRPQALGQQHQQSPRALPQQRRQALPPQHQAQQRPQVMSPQNEIQQRPQVAPQQGQSQQRRQVLPLPNQIQQRPQALPPQQSESQQRPQTLPPQRDQAQQRRQDMPPHNRIQQQPQAWFQQSQSPQHPSVLPMQNQGQQRPQAWPQHQSAQNLRAQTQQSQSRQVRPQQQSPQRPWAHLQTKHNIVQTPRVRLQHPQTMQRPQGQAPPQRLSAQRPQAQVVQSQAPQFMGGF